MDEDDAPSKALLFNRSRDDSHTPEVVGADKDTYGERVEKGNDAPDKDPIDFGSETSSGNFEEANDTVGNETGSGNCEEANGNKGINRGDFSEATGVVDAGDCLLYTSPSPRD